MGSDTNGGRPRSSSRTSSRLGGFSRFSPSFNRTNSSSSFNSKQPIEESSSYARYDSDDDASGGRWAADVRKPASQSWRESGFKFDSNLSSDDDDPADRLHPSSASKPAFQSRARSGTVTPKNPQPQNPFAASADDLSASRDDIFNDNYKSSSSASASRNRYHGSDDDDLFDPRRDSIDSAHTINTQSDSSADDAGGRKGKFLFQGQKMKQEKALLNGGNDEFAPTPPPRPKVQSTAGVAVALYDFVGQEEGDLSFKRGDRIDILKKPPGEEWWVGKIGLKQGILPKNYVLLDD